LLERIAEVSAEEAKERLMKLVEADETVSGATLLTPDGRLEYLDVSFLRRGGRA